MSGARLPLSRYRQQFNTRFTFKDAAAIVPYLAGLGISDGYASSYLAAVPEIALNDRARSYDAWAGGRLAAAA